jgi:nucleotide-binding universal stress UspA family protein
MFAKVLVPLDGSKLAEGVLPYVRDLTRGGATEVQLLRVREPTSPYLADPAHQPYLHQIEDSIASHVQDYLQEVSRPLRDLGVRISFLVKAGSPAAQIIAEAAEDPDCLIAMSTHGRSGLTRWVMGSVTSKVLQGTKNPMLVVRPDEKNPPAEVNLDTIIVPLDGSALSEQALPYAVRLATELKLRVVLARVTPSEGEYHQYLEEQRMGAGVTAYSGPYEEFSEKADAEAMGYLREVKERLLRVAAQDAPSEVTEKVLHGRPAEAIAELARKSPHNLIAMCTHGRSGLGRWVLGSVTDRVVSHASNPVLVIRATESEGRR